LTGNNNLTHLRANRTILARRINEIACRMDDLRSELKTLAEEMKAKAHQLDEVERVLGADNISALRARMLTDMSRHPSARAKHRPMIETNDQ
jgi:chromosome segregation ATPase